MSHINWEEKPSEEDVSKSGKVLRQGLKKSPVGVTQNLSTAYKTLSPSRNEIPRGTKEE